MEFTDAFFTWEYLATYSGAMVATGFITHFLKQFLSKYNIPTEIIAWMVGVSLLMLAFYFTGQLTVSNAVLTILNGMLLAAATSGAVSGSRALSDKINKSTSKTKE